MLRWAVAIALAGILIAAATLLQMFTAAYLLGLISGLLLGMVPRLKLAGRNRAA
jgi:hypothetical protein